MYKPMQITIIAAIAIIIIIIIIVLVMTRTMAAPSFFAQREAFSAEDAGLTGIIPVPYVATKRYEFFPNKDTVGAGLIRVVGGIPTGLTERHEYVARACDDEPGCVAATSTGVLYYSVLPPESRKTWDYGTNIAGCGPSGCGLLVRKNALPNPLYVQLFPDINYGTNADVGRVLVPVGSYPDVNYIGSAPGVIGGTMPRNKLSSIIVPRGLKVVLYEKANYSGWQLPLRFGSYPDLRVFKTGNVLRPTWNDEVVSIVVSHDNAY